MQGVKEQLSSIHPVFRIPSTKVFWADNVMKKNTHNSLQTRFLVISSAGIFLFERKSFPKGLVISRMIPYSDLVLITANSDESFEFFKAKVTMRLQHPNNAEIVAMVIAIRDVLFGDKTRYPKLVFDEEIRVKIENSNFMFETDSLLADRFLCLSIETPVRNLVYDQLFDYYEKLKISPLSFSINAEMMASNLISPLSLAIAYDSGIQSLQLDGINFSSFVSYFKAIILNNSSIQNLLLKSVSFNDSLTEFIKILNQKTACQINFFSFLHCQLISTNFITFLSSFSKYKVDIQTLLFISCNIDKAVLEKILTTISSSKCFSGLNELYINELKEKNPIDNIFNNFFDSPFISNHKNLRNLSIINCQLNLEKILSHISAHDKSIQVANFSHNSFMSDLQITNFGSLEEIDFSSCAFTSNSLCSLFQLLSTISKSKGHIPSEIIFNDLNVTDKEWTDFYERISRSDYIDSFSPVTNLKMFSWCNNKMNGKQVETFIGFLSGKFPNISEIGLSFSIQNAAIDTSLPLLAKYFASHTISKLDFRGGSGSLFGHNMEDLLKALLQNGSIKMLDITGQRSGAKCYDLLTQMVSTCLEELRFDGNAPNDVEIMKNFLNTLIQSKLNYAEWPEKDIKDCVSKIKLSARSTTVNAFKDLQKAFSQKFVPPNNVNNLYIGLGSSSSSFQNDSRSSDDTDFLDSNNLFLRQRSASILKSKLKSEGTINRESKRTHSIDLQYLKNRSQAVDAALFECFGEPGIESEPLVVALEKLDRETSIDAFLNSHK